METTKASSPGNEMLTFKYLQNRIESINLPSASWSYSRGNELFFGLQRVEDDGTIRKRVAVLPDLSLKIIVDNNLMPLCKYIKVRSIEEFENLLKDVNDYP